MSERGLTRRALLTAGAGAVLAEAARPRGALAALVAAPEPTLWARWVGTLGPAGRTVAIERNADLLGVSWSGPSARIELRIRGQDGRWSRWVSATGCTGEHGQRGQVSAHSLSAAGALVGDSVWTGGTTEVQLRASQVLTGVRLQLVDVSAGVGAQKRAMLMGALSSAAALASPVLDAGPGQPPIIARQVWARGMARPAVTPAYGDVRMAFVHHTENPNGYVPAEVPAMLLAIYVFHRYVRGWDDIGYNFVVDLFGRIYEARAGGIDEPVVGAQAGGYNEVSTGIAVLGSFSSVPISAPARQALERLLAWKLALHGVPAQGRVTVRVDPAGAAYSRFPGGSHVSLPRIAGHRDADTTACPGDALYGELPSVRPHVARLAGRPARATLALHAPQSTGAPGQSGAVRTLSGRLVGLDGRPIVGAPIAVQERSVSRRGEAVHERTLIQTLTGAEGEWSLPVTIEPRRGGSWVRALSVGGTAATPRSFPVSVSEPLHVPGTLVPAPGASVPVSAAPGLPGPSPAGLAAARRNLGYA